MRDLDLDWDYTGDCTDIGRIELVQEARQGRGEVSGVARQHGLEIAVLHDTFQEGSHCSKALHRRQAPLVNILLSFSAVRNWGFLTMDASAWPIRENMTS